MVRLELIFVFMVVLAGSVVRMTGSGMGCPDWPKCFGHLIPPTEESQVMWHPNTEYHAGQMIVHEEALWSSGKDFTTGTEYDPTAWEKYTRHDYALFNPWHTWTEYINRLFGALSGVPMFLLFVIGLTYVRKKPLYTVLSTTGLFLLGFEAWLGKVVVDGHLIPGQITIHMAGAFVILMLLVVFLYVLSATRDGRSALPFPKTLLMITLLALLAQVILGTQVREVVDELTRMYGEGARIGWTNRLGNIFYVHRSASLVIAALVGYMAWKHYRIGRVPAYLAWTSALVVLSILSGVLLYYLDLPRYLQPVHLMLSAGIASFLTWGVMGAYARSGKG